MPFADLFLFLEDPAALIVIAAIMLLTISTVRDRRQHRRRASRLREHFLTDTMMHFRSNGRLGSSPLHKAR
jgi:hypothetical protein